MTKSKQKLLQTLTRCKSEAESRVERLREELAEAASDLQGYAGAIESLGGVEQESTADTPTPGLKADDVRQLARELIADSPRIDRGALYDRARQKLADEGQSASGLGLHLGRVLKEPWVEEVEEGAYRLSEVND